MTKRKSVNVDMIATGTDVKPLECLIFMRNIKSWSYFEQMKGRDLASKRRTSRNEALKQGPGSRVIDSASLKSVTPDAACKTRFVIVDAVGLCKQDKNQSKPLDRQSTVTLERQSTVTRERAFSPTKREVSKGVVHPDLASTLGAKISRLAVSQLISTLFDSVDADKNRELAASKFNVTPEQVTDTQLDEIEAEQVRAALYTTINGKVITGNTNAAFATYNHLQMTYLIGTQQ